MTFRIHKNERRNTDDLVLMILYKNEKNFEGRRDGGKIKVTQLKKCEDAS